MTQRYECQSSRRLTAARSHAGINAIEWIEVVEDHVPLQQTLIVRCVDPLPAGIDGDHVVIVGGVRIVGIGVTWAARADLAPEAVVSEELERTLVVRCDAAGDFSTYVLRLEQGGTPLAGFDPLLAEIEFSFKVACPSDFDCAPVSACEPDTLPAPRIDYLAKDFDSFKRLMLDRLSVTLPQWRERNPADIGIAVVELLAHSADLLSYHQDAAGTEAYLGTSRSRVSVRRHARLLDYPLHEGCNARAWVSVQAPPGAAALSLPREFAGGHTFFCTRIETLRVADGSLPGQIDAEAYARAAQEADPQVFEPLYDIDLFEAHNELRFHTWGEQRCGLAAGATSATLLDHQVDLAPGMVLIFEEVRGPATGANADADPARRHAVRLTAVELTTDLLANQLATPPSNAPLPVTNIEWHPDDALPFGLCISALVDEDGDDVLAEDISVARGNVVLVDHGQRVADEILPGPQDLVRHRPALAEPALLHVEEFSTTQWNAGPTLSAAAAVQQDPKRALPDLVLTAEGEPWSARRDLLESERFDPHFVAERESDGRSALRFGDDLFGRAMTDQSVANYRVGDPESGNVGADSIRHAVTVPGLDLVRVRNPLPAFGGTAAEDLERVRRIAPQAFRTQQRAVTEEDYARTAALHPEVQAAVARRLWTGSWHTMFIAIDRVGGRPVDVEFEGVLQSFLDEFKLAGHDIEIEPPVFVPLDIAMRVCVTPDSRSADVQALLLEAFGSGTHKDGSPAFFHPDRFGFGGPLYLSDVVATAMAVPGVHWVTIDQAEVPPGRFQRWGEPPRGEIEAGVLLAGRREILRLDNDPNAPENGHIEFLMDGGA